jgi:hypothetical protein
MLGAGEFGVNITLDIAALQLCLKRENKCEKDKLSASTTSFRLAVRNSACWMWWRQQPGSDQQIVARPKPTLHRSAWSRRGGR